jgi:TM2 domain-containing membrane protein YozV
MAEAEWYYSQNGQQQGPVTLEALQGMVRAGQVTASDLAWKPGMANWIASAQVPELGVAQPTFPAPGVQAVHQQPFVQPPYPPQGQPPAYAPTPGYPQAFQQQPIAGYTPPPPYAQSPPNKVAAGVCGILLGALGIHKFVLGYTGAGIAMLLVTVLTCGYGGLIMGPIGLIEGIIYLAKSDQDFYRDYVVGKRSWF